MHRSATLPFLIKRGSDAFSGVGMTATRETVHGLLSLEGQQLTIQWRAHRKTDHIGATELRTDTEVDPVAEIVVPVALIAGASVKRDWWSWPFPLKLVLNARDLGAFEDMAGSDQLKLDHPAELILRLRRSDRLAGEEFCAELALAIAEGSLEAGRGAPELPSASDGTPGLSPGLPADPPSPPRLQD